MTPDVLCLATAAARAIAFAAGASIPPAELNPPHPAFVGFRRMTYIWFEGNELQPVGDDVGLWLEFLATRGGSEAAVAFADDAAVLQVEADGASMTWRVVSDEWHMRMEGRVASRTDPPMGGMSAARDRLHEALAAELQAGAEPTRDAALRRATALLESDGDGSELSDVAWPYFVLPSAAYDLGARRLLAAACAAWPDATETGAEADGALAAAREAVAAALNSARST